MLMMNNVIISEILKLVMGGRMGLAIEHTLRSYPGLLENNQNLLFMLKCRQFVEMVNGSDFEVSKNRIEFKYIPFTNNDQFFRKEKQTMN